MAKSQSNSASTIPLIIFAFLLLASSSSFSVVVAARLLIIKNVAAEPARNLILPGIIAAEEGSQGGGGRYLPCDSGNRKVGVMGFEALRLCGKHSEVVLSMLPKGVVPPSGPSRRTNDVNN
uniref:Uncharacterized protein n=1 Tax=Cannabis sativa TaxID=3483 RepID=A0A803P1G9_CANSA